jgi:uncharacterized protein (TIGR02284 family)
MDILLIKIGDDTMHNTSIQELNALLKGEHMAIHGYEKYMENINDPNIKSQFQKIQIDHKQHAIRLAERIQNLGGHPCSDIGVAGEIGQLMSSVKSFMNKDNQSIVNQAYTGEKNGIEVADELVKGDLDDQSRTLVNDILDVDRSHLSTLNELINH